MIIAMLMLAFNAHATELEVIDHSGMNHAPLTQQFKDAFTMDKRRHTFIQLFDDVKNIKIGTFGYHISEFGSNHQHQLILRADNYIVGRDLDQSVKLISGVFKTKPSKGFYTVTSDGPKQVPAYETFLLNEVITQKRTEFPTDLYDGIIGDGILTKKPWLYKVKEIVFTTPMLAVDKKLDKNIYIVFGLNDDKAAKKKYFMAHFMWGFEANYDHVIEVEFNTPEVIPNGVMMVIQNQAVEKPLEVGKSYTGQVDQQAALGFKVTKQIRKAMLNENKPKK